MDTSAHTSRARRANEVLESKGVRAAHCTMCQRHFDSVGSPVNHRPSDEESKSKHERTSDHSAGQVCSIQARSNQKEWSGPEQDWTQWTDDVSNHKGTKQPERRAGRVARLRRGPGRRSHTQSARTCRSHVKSDIQEQQKQHSDPPGKAVRGNVPELGHGTFLADSIRHASSRRTHSQFRRGNVLPPTPITWIIFQEIRKQISNKQTANRRTQIIATSRTQSGDWLSCHAVLCARATMCVGQLTCTCAWEEQ